MRYRNNRGDTDSYSNQARGIDPDLIVVPTDTLLLRYQRAHSPSFSYNLRGDVTYTAVAADTRCKGNITLAVMTT